MGLLVRFMSHISVSKGCISGISSKWDIKRCGLEEEFLQLWLISTLLTVGFLACPIDVLKPGEKKKKITQCNVSSIEGFVLHLFTLFYFICKYRILNYLSLWAYFAKHTLHKILFNIVDSHWTSCSSYSKIKTESQLVHFNSVMVLIDRMSQNSFR